MPCFIHFLVLFVCFQASFYSTALKTLISVSTVILLGLIVAYHALEVQVRDSFDSLHKLRNNWFSYSLTVKIIWKHSVSLSLCMSAIRFVDEVLSRRIVILYRHYWLARVRSNQYLRLRATHTHTSNVRLLSLLPLYSFSFFSISLRGLILEDKRDWRLGHHSQASKRPLRFFI